MHVGVFIVFVLSLALHQQWSSGFSLLIPSWSIIGWDEQLTDEIHIAESVHKLYILHSVDRDLHSLVVAKMSAMQLSSVATGIHARPTARPMRRCRGTAFPTLTR
jgi:hypothetical protein